MNSGPDRSIIAEAAAKAADLCGRARSAERTLAALAVATYPPDRDTLILLERIVDRIALDTARLARDLDLASAA